MKTIQDLQAELKQLQNKINTSLANGEYSPDMPIWREGVRKILEELGTTNRVFYNRFKNVEPNIFEYTTQKALNKPRIFDFFIVNF